MKKADFAIFILILFTSSSAWAAEVKSGDMELLEFLGNFETSSGRPVDPLLFKQDSKNSKTKDNSVTQQKERRQQKDKSDLKERDYEK